MKTERPILFSGPLVRRILDGEKTQTRRLVGLDTLQPSTTPGYDWTWRGQAPIRSIAQQRRHPRGCWQDVRAADFLKLCPYGLAGDRLWVREAWNYTAPSDIVPGDAVGPISKYNPALRVVYREGSATRHPDHPEWGKTLWRPSIHMPRWASRITLEVTAVRVERLQAITEADIVAEGVTLDLAEERTGTRPRDLRHAWELGWDSINGSRGSWAANPWVWCVSFSRVDQEAKAA